MTDISLLPTPDVLSIKSFETILAENIAELKKLKPDYQWLESDDYMLLIQAFAYRELHIRQEFNNRLKATFLLTAKGTDLDARVMDYGVTRLTNEKDTALLQRTLDSLERFSTAGSAGSYEYHAKSASSLVHDAKAVSPAPNKITVYITNYDNAFDDKKTKANVIALVKATLDDPKKWPLCFQHNVVLAEVQKETLKVKVELIDINDQAAIETLIREKFARNFALHESLTVFEIVNNCNVVGVRNAQTLNHSNGIRVATGKRLVIDDLQLTFTQAGA